MTENNLRNASKMFSFTDKAEVTGTRRRESDGALLVDARVARTGIQLYNGSEVGRPDLAIVRVYRSPEEVFARDAMASFAHRPITNDHPPEAVTIDNWKRHAVGNSSDQVSKDGDFIRVPLMISDAAAINDILAGKRELSPGYTCNLDWTAGKTPAGEEFDCQQKTIRDNHIAIVDSGRSGPKVRIGDHWSAPTTHDNNQEAAHMTTKTMIVDGLPILVTDAAEAMINKLQRTISDMTASASKLVTDHAAALAAKDTKIGELTADNKKLSDAAIKPEMLAKMVTDRANLVTVAKTVSPNAKLSDTMTDADIRRAVVTDKLGADLVKDANDDAVTGMFLAVTKDAKPAAAATMADPFAAVMRDAPTGQQMNDNGYQDRLKRLSDGYKNKTA